MDGPFADRRDTRLKVAALLAVFVLLALAHRFGVLQRFADPAGAARTLRGLGSWGYLAFIASYALLQPFGIPGTVFVVAAPLIWRHSRSPVRHRRQGGHRRPNSRPDQQPVLQRSRRGHRYVRERRRAVLSLAPLRSLPFRALATSKPPRRAALRSAVRRSRSC